jgi:hypothetical protein
MLSEQSPSFIISLLPLPLARALFLCVFPSRFVEKKLAGKRAEKQLGRTRDKPMGNDLTGEERAALSRVEQAQGQRHPLQDLTVFLDWLVQGGEGVKTPSPLSLTMSAGHTRLCRHQKERS